MQNAARKVPTGGRGRDDLDKARREIFAHCKLLGLDDEQRRQLASQYRPDRLPTMQGMSLQQLKTMAYALRIEAGKREQFERQRARAERTTRLAQHKRVDGERDAAGRVVAYASERARHELRERAEELWGDDWEARLNGFLQKTAREFYEQPDGKFLVTWDFPKLPRALHWRAREGVGAMLKRNSKFETRNSKGRNSPP